MTEERGTVGQAGSEGLPGGPPSKDACTFAMLAHLLGAIVGFLGPLIIWLVKREEHPFIDDQGKEALNFQLTLLIGWVISGVLSCVFIGILLMPIVFLLQIIFGIIGAMKANKGEQYRYPFAIRMIK